LRIEAVIVDNASSDETHAVIARWAKAMPFRVLIAYEERKGLSYARNTGLRTATGAILVFTDDDCRLDPDYFLVLERHYRQDTGPVVRGGRVELGNVADLPIGIKLDGAPKTMGTLDHPGHFIIGANMVLPRAALQMVGWFDVRFGAGGPFMAAEETDYIYRSYMHHLPVEYVPDLIVHHFHGRQDARAVAALNHGYHVGGGALYAKYITTWHLLRHFYWDVRKCVLSLWTGTLYDDRLHLSYWSVIVGNISGMVRYATYAITHRRPNAHDS
jgi:glycosyltransferase involved in cell wall biosynthesis